MILKNILASYHGTMMTVSSGLLTCHPPKNKTPGK